jgi:hypothetical protein
LDGTAPTVGESLVAPQSGRQMRPRQAHRVIGRPPHSFTPNSGRYVAAYLCADLNVVTGDSNRQFSFIVCTESAPTDCLRLTLWPPPRRTCIQMVWRRSARQSTAETGGGPPPDRDADTAGAPRDPLPSSTLDPTNCLPRRAASRSSTASTVPCHGQRCSRHTSTRGSFSSNATPLPAARRTSSTTTGGTAPPTRLPFGLRCDATNLVVMADPFSDDAFCGSARDFALSALEAHHAGNHRRVPLDAGTALEHLAKACLAQRSRALLAELKGDSAINSLIGLLRIEGAAVPARIRTIGLSEALTRAGLFVRSKAAKDDLQILTNMRNGIVHAAEDTEVEERILAAFAQQADAFLTELGRDREDFWSGQLAVVDALLKDASDKLAHRIEVRLAAAAAMLERRIATDGEAVIRLLRATSKTTPLTATQRLHECPVCDSFGIATGEHTIEWPLDWDEEAQVVHLPGEVWFIAEAFHCRVCGLRLDSQAEIDACFDPVWEIEDADWRDYEPEPDPDAAYDHWREDTHEP